MVQIIRRRDLDVLRRFETVEHGEDPDEFVLVPRFQFYRIRVDRFGQADLAQVELRPGFTVKFEHEICLLIVLGGVRQVFRDSATDVQTHPPTVLVGEDEFQHLVRVLALPGIDAHAEVIHEGRGRLGDRLQAWEE